MSTRPPVPGPVPWRGPVPAAGPGTDVLDRLASADPGRHTPPFEPAQAARLLDRATATATATATAAAPATAAVVVPPAGPVRRRRPVGRLVLSAVAVAAVTAVAVVVLPGGVVAPSDARAVDSLLAAGRAAAAAADAPVGPGQRIYSQTASGSWTEATLPDGGTVVSVQPSTREIWAARDGSAVYRQVVAGQPWFPTEAARRAYARMWAAQGGPPAVGSTTVETIPAYAGSVNAPTYDFARTLPTDPAALERLIRDATAGAGESPDVEVWVTVRDMLSWPVSPPALRAALYQVAAHVPGVDYLGTVRDRLGRPGVAVALDHGDAGHARTREVMVFDPSTGLLLQSEERALDPVQWGLPASMTGTVTGWQVFVRSAVVEGPGILPGGEGHVALTATSSH